DSFTDHFSQAKMFLNSLSKTEQQHLYDAFSFELSKCDMDIRNIVVKELINKIDRNLAEYVADHTGAELPAENEESTYEKSSPALSMMNTNFSLNTRTVGVIITPDVTEDTLDETRRDRKSTRLNSSHVSISYAVFCLKKNTRYHL